MSKIKIVRTLEITSIYDADVYWNMTPERAAEYERTLPENDAIEQVVTELTDDGSGSSAKVISTQVEIIDADLSGDAA